MMSNGRQFVLLLWKNYLIQRRKVFITILEIGLPSLFAVLLIIVRLNVSGSNKSSETWSDCDYKTLEVWPVHLPRRIAFTPDHEAVKRLMSKIGDKIPGMKADNGFTTEKKMVDFLLFVNKTVNNTRDYIGGISFTNDFEDDGRKFSKKIEYKIRLSSYPRTAGREKFDLNPFDTDSQWFTKFMFPMFQSIGPRQKKDNCGGLPGYDREGFLALQSAVNYLIFQEIIGNDSTEKINGLDLRLRRHPYPPYDDDQFVLVIQNDLPMVLMLSFVLVVLNIVKDVVYEKEKKLKEAMKLMGVNNWLHWSAWFVKYLLFLLITVLIMTIFFCIPTENGSIVGDSEPTLLFFFMVCYAISTISFCFLVSVFFSKANSAAAAAGIIFFISYIPYFFLKPRYDTLSWGQKAGIGLIFNVNMAFGAQIFGMFQGIGTGVTWSNFANGVSPDDSFAVLHVMLIFLVDSVIYCVIAWYVEAVFPGEFGMPEPWYFPLTKSYWCGSIPCDMIVEDKCVNIGQNPEYFEDDPVDIKAGVQVRNLQKVFGDGDARTVAVAGMSLDMYEGQILALLGHNGAGKTTTMSMLTGFLPPTGGTAYVNGFDIQRDMSSVRQSMGLCPQHNILFDTLTVEEHLIFFAKLKGCPSDQVKKEVNEMLESINLVNKRNAQVKTLSGGMKRKLSISLALIGGSKIVMLDEPSSGLDPDARRQIWTMLQNNCHGRTMILTTHFMDEADVLADRIAIMSEGVVQCCGSSLFLKKKYGAGYHMVIVKEQDCDVNNITQLVTSFVPEAEMKSNIGAELSYILPNKCSHKFEELFTNIQSQKNDLGISSYGVSVTTMEEVFLRVGKNADSAPSHRKERVPANPDFSLSQSISIINRGEREPLLGQKKMVIKNSDQMLRLQQFYAMFVKRVLHTFRNKLVTVTQLAAPIFFTLMALIVLKTFPGPQDSPALELDLSAFDVTYTVYSKSLNSSENLQDIANFYVTQFQKSKSQLINVGDEPGYEKDPNIVNFLLMEGERSISTYNMHYMIGVDFNQSLNQLNKSEYKIAVTGYFNNQGYHTPAISLAAVSNAVVRYITNSSEFQLSTINHPLPRTYIDKIRDQQIDSTAGFTVAFNIVFGMAFLASSFTVFLIKEQATKAKHIQCVSGVKTFEFWMSTFCWDFINYLIPCVCLLVLLLAFNIEAYVVEGHIWHILLLFVMHGWAVLPFMYLWSLLFNIPATGFVWITMFNIVAGTAVLLAVTILSIPQLGLQYIAEPLELISLLIIPNYCLGQGLQDYYNNYQLQEICAALPPNPCCGTTKGTCPWGPTHLNSNFLGWDNPGIARMLVFNAIQGLVYFIILFFLESSAFNSLKNKIMRKSGPSSEYMFLDEPGNMVQEDTDVAQERARIANTPLKQLFNVDKLVLQELKKCYGSNIAVNEISIGIPQGECFGLLGINGAGKTTTFKMLTGDETISSGNAFVSSYNVKQDIKQAQQHIGYCPQFDALIGHMTGKETLYMFARLRGVFEKQIPKLVDNLLATTELTMYADNRVSAYSGGNKRKLSTAVALVGDPPIIFLDEPTTGMDPAARRSLWDTLASVRDSGRTLILTSHSMEECEVLCTRLAMMVNGQFKCLGSPQHLKSKFGEGYTLIAKVGLVGGKDTKPLMMYIEEQFPGSKLKDIHEGMVNYHITNTSLSWADIFGMMERAKQQYNIEDYSVSQTTLEQVFINFARSQLPPCEINLGCCSICKVCFCCCASDWNSETRSTASSYGHLDNEPVNT